MRLERKLRTWQEATHKALRCWLLGQQKPFPQHDQQGSTPAEAAAPHNEQSVAHCMTCLQGQLVHWLLQKGMGKAKYALGKEWLAHLNMGTVRYRSAVTPDTT